jgi:hypothetical protein
MSTDSAFNDNTSVAPYAYDALPDQAQAGRLKADARGEDERAAGVLKRIIVALALCGNIDAAEARRLIVEYGLEAA